MACVVCLIVKEGILIMIDLSIVVFGQVEFASGSKILGDIGIAHELLLAAILAGKGVARLLMGGISFL